MTEEVDLEEESAGPTYLDLFGEALLEGLTFDEPMRRLFAGAIRDAMDVSGLGLEPELIAHLDLFDRSAEARLVMGLAREAGIPFSEARRRWSDPEDLAAELAWRALEAADHWARCPNCGIDPADMMRPDGQRPLAEGKWKFVSKSCYVCSTLASLREGSDEEKGRSFRMVPRGPRDPMFEE